MAVRVQQRILDALGKVDRPGTFCMSGILPPTLPGLDVSGVGPLALPLAKLQAAALKKVARQAPYGKGTRTLVDTSVRRVWEIEADQIKLANPEWHAVVRQAVQTVQSELGLEKQKLEAHLYKLLLYEPGSFFLAHRDGEKLDRMVATLVIVLPAAHEGGELVVRHEGSEEVVDFSAKSQFQTQFAAFYADCEHEIRPVRSGFRLALVYNLTLEKSKRTITAPTSREHIAAVASLLRQWNGQKRTTVREGAESAPSKLAVLLDHQYTQAGLSRDALKGIDRAKADVLFAAAQDAGCDASLALVTYWESGSAEPSGDYGYGYGERRGYGRDEDDFDDTGGHGHIMGEVFDNSLTAEHFSDAEGHPLAFGGIPLDDDEIVSKQRLDEGEPDKEDFEGFTGNAGMTLERWYHRAAVVLWPAASRFDVLCEAGVEAAVGGLEQMIRHWKREKQDEQASLKSSCLEFARRIIAHWPERIFVSGYDRIDAYGGDDTESNESFDEGDGGDELDEEDDDFREEDDGCDSPTLVGVSQAGRAASRVPSRPLLSLLDDLGDVSLISAWIRNVLWKDASIHPGEMFGDLCEQYGWLTFQDELRELFERTNNETIERHAQLLADFSLCKDKSAGRGKLCAALAQQLASVLPRWDPRPVEGDWRAKTVDLCALLTLLTQTFLVLEEPKLLEQLVAYVLDRPKPFDGTTIQIPALLGLETWLKRNVKHPVAPLHCWFTAIIAELESRAARPPQEPADWRRESVTGCSCADCKELSRFLDDPHTATFRLPLAEQRRRHLHRTIDSKQLDTTHVTERRGRPYTLVCTKTKASYERALKAHHVDLEQLARMRKLLEWHDRLNAARPRFGNKTRRRRKNRTSSHAETET